MKATGEAVSALGGSSKALFNTDLVYRELCFSFLESKLLHQPSHFCCLANICQQLYPGKSVIERIITVSQVSESKIVFSLSNIH